jgi:hypothetical protein
LADLKALIEAGGYSQSEVARALGTTRQKAHSWFRQVNPHAPGLEDGLAIADLLRQRPFFARARACEPEVRLPKRGDPLPERICEQ